MDTASPTVSVAVGRGGVCLARRSVELRRSSENLLRLVDEALAEAGATLEELDGVIALRGPGSFTGLRVGLATCLGIHQALGLPATAVPTLEVLAEAARDSAEPSGTSGPVVAVVDALRGEWFSQLFAPSGEPLEAAPAIRTPEEIAALDPALVIGFGARRLAESDGWSPNPVDPAGPAGAPRARVLDLAADGPGELAPAALRLAARMAVEAPERIDWSPTTLTSPLYLRPPATTLPKPRGRAKAGARASKPAQDPAG